MSLFSLRGVSKLIEITILLNEKLGHEIKSRALITMYDSRTRYSRVVLEKVKAEFGENVFESVIRYNIRLRETVDHGLPVGDYDKHAIGAEDYENLADEIIRSAAADIHKELNSLGSAQDILQKTEGFIDSAPKTTGFEQSSYEPDVGPTHTPESTYTEMVEAIATAPADPYLEYKD